MLSKPQEWCTIQDAHEDLVPAMLANDADSTSHSLPSFSAVLAATSSAPTVPATTHSDHEQAGPSHSPTIPPPSDSFPIIARQAIPTSAGQSASTVHEAVDLTMPQPCSSTPADASLDVLPIVEPTLMPSSSALDAPTDATCTTPASVPATD